MAACAGSTARGTAVAWPPTHPSHLLSLASAPAGQLWVGTEDEGVWRYDPSADPPWRQLTCRDGLGDDSAYALAIDPLGRVWVGHLNHGVSVFNGTTWRNYGQLTGPLGARVFDIAVHPCDGSVWIGTDLGVAVWHGQPAHDPLPGVTETGGDHGQDAHATAEWSYLTRADGLPSDQITAITFSAAGEAVIGTDCQGVVVLRGGASLSGSLSRRERVGVRAAGEGATGLESPHPAADGRPLPVGERFRIRFAGWFLTPLPPGEVAERSEAGEGR
ncbi:MAG: hypothetical protein HYU66_15580 [Armatimonadetes bacterium]|nr:hypothetical protein [Armatimonadota bacterium]